MAYNNQIPLASDRLQRSQADILANFEAINTVFAFDHVAFNDPNQGKHNRTTMFVNTGTITSPANTANIFLTAITPNEGAFAWVRESSSRNIVFGDGELNEFGTPDAGFQFLFSGLVLKWQTVRSTFTAGAAQNFFWQAGPQFTSNPFFINIQLNYGNSFTSLGTSPIFSIVDSTVTPTSFSIRFDDGPTFMTAIGGTLVNVIAIGPV